MIYIYCVGKTRRTWLGGFRLFYLKHLVNNHKHVKILGQKLTSVWWRRPVY